jgi:aryl sulfotransferase
MAKQLILIASYPKSGNTWVRLVLQGIIDASRAGNVNAVDGGFYGVQRRQLFDELAPANAADLTPAEIDDFLPSVNTVLTRMLEAPAILKTHELVRRNRAGAWIYDPEQIQAVLHIVRHPFDVAVSFAHHMGWTAEQAVGHMGSPFRFSSQDYRLSLPFPEPVGTWSDNVLGWTNLGQPYRCLTVRYEDLLLDSMQSFHRISVFAGFEVTEFELQRAVDAASFDKLQAQEAAKGFRERPTTSPQFFRAGKTLSWEGALSEDLQRRISNRHAEAMHRFGYCEDGTTTPELPQL